MAQFAYDQLLFNLSDTIIVWSLKTIGGGWPDDLQKSEYIHTKSINVLYVLYGENNQVW